MAYPSGAPSPLRRFGWGVPIALVPSSDQTAHLELWRKTTQESTYTPLVTLRADSLGKPPTFYIDKDVIPFSTFSYSYKLRHTKDGYDNSAFSTATSLQGRELTGRDIAITPLTGRGVGANLYMAAGKTVQYGRAAAATAVESTIYVMYTAFTRETSGDKVAYGIGYMQTQSTAATYAAQGSIQVPKGVTITQIAARLRRASSVGDTAQALIYSVTGSGGFSLLATLTHASAAGYATVASSAMTTVASSNGYIGRVLLKRSNPTLGNEAIFVWLRVRYTRTGLDKVY